MNSTLLEPYQPRDSVMHRLPAMIKLPAALALVVMIALCPIAHASYLGIAAAMLIIIALLGRVSWRLTLSRLLLLEPFALGVAVLAIFGPGGWPMFFLLVAKTTLCLTTMILMSATTPFGELLVVLRRMRVPALLITTLALMYRYLFILVDETTRMRRARLSRTFAPRRDRIWTMMANVVGQLFIRAFNRAERVYAAMCARGWS
jgi:cobalt/nickel transport system permease protein